MSETFNGFDDLSQSDSSEVGAVQHEPYNPSTTSGELFCAFMGPVRAELFSRVADLEGAPAVTTYAYDSLVVGGAPGESLVLAFGTDRDVDFVDRTVRLIEIEDQENFGA